MEVLCLIFTMYNFGGGNSFKINSLTKRAISTFFAVIFFFALGAIVDTREARGQWTCPSGSVLKHFDFDWSPPGLPLKKYRVHYCLSCGTSTNNATIIPLGITPLDGGQIPISNPAHFNSFYDLYRDLLRDDAIKGCEKPPCGTGTKSFEFISHKCVKFRNIVDLDPSYVSPDPFTPVVEMIFCEDLGICHSTANYCWDYSFTPPRPVLMSVQIWSFGEFCPLWWENLPPYHLWGNGMPWETDCYSMFNDCTQIRPILIED